VENFSAVVTTVFVHPWVHPYVVLLVRLPSVNQLKFVLHLLLNKCSVHIFISLVPGLILVGELVGTGNLMHSVSKMVDGQNGQEGKLVGWQNGQCKRSLQLGELGVGELVIRLTGQVGELLVGDFS